MNGWIRKVPKVRKSNDWRFQFRLDGATVSAGGFTAESFADAIEFCKVQVPGLDAMMRAGCQHEFQTAGRETQFYGPDWSLVLSNPDCNE